MATVKFSGRVHCGGQPSWPVSWSLVVSTVTVIADTVAVIYVVNLSSHCCGHFDGQLYCSLWWSVVVATVVVIDVVSFSVHSDGQSQCSLWWSLM